MKIYTLLLCLFASFSFSVGLLGQSNNAEAEKEDPSKFTIIITTNENGFQMECREGCAWLNLSFSDYTMEDGKIHYKKAIVDDSGVGSYYESPDEKYDAEVKSATDFAFIVQQTEDGVYLESLKGTVWKKLSYRCIEPNCRQAIDDMGMMELDPAIDR